VICSLGTAVPLAVRAPEMVKDWWTAGVEFEVVAVRVVEAGLTVGVALRLAARVELEVVGVRVVEAGCASTAGVALQNNNAQTTNTTAATITTRSFAYIPPNLEP